MIQQLFKPLLRAALLLSFFASAIHANDAEIIVSDKLEKVEEKNIFKDPHYYQWCSSILKGEDGKYHLIYSRWRRELGFYAWLTHSEGAHAVADSPEGPYKYVNTLLDLRQETKKAGSLITAHNPKIKFFEGRYYLYFISTTSPKDLKDSELVETAKVGYSHPNWQPLRRNQRVFVASAASLNDSFQISDGSLIEPSGPITTLTVNPAITQGPDGRYYLIVKGDKPHSTKFERNQAMAISQSPDKGFTMQPKAVIESWDTEDVSLFYHPESKRFYAVFHAHHYVGMMSSRDGINWQKAQDFQIMKKQIPLKSGGFIQPQRMERPFLFVENGKARVLSLAVKKGNDSYIVFVPIKSL